VLSIRNFCKISRKYREFREMFTDLYKCSGARQLRNLTNILSSCQAEINASCDASALPIVNQTLVTGTAQCTVLYTIYRIHMYVQCWCIIFLRLRAEINASCDASVLPAVNQTLVTGTVHSVQYIFTYTVLMHHFVAAPGRYQSLLRCFSLTCCSQPDTSHRYCTVLLLMHHFVAAPGRNQSLLRCFSLANSQPDTRHRYCTLCTVLMHHYVAAPGRNQRLLRCFSLASPDTSHRYCTVNLMHHFFAAPGRNQRFLRCFSLTCGQPDTSHRYCTVLMHHFVAAPDRNQRLLWCFSLACSQPCRRCMVTGIGTVLRRRIIVLNAGYTPFCLSNCKMNKCKLSV
jgi:hypothetical protein